MLSLRQVLITAWIVLLVVVFLRHIDSTSSYVQSAQPANEAQIMRVVDKP